MSGRGIPERSEDMPRKPGTDTRERTTVICRIDQKSARTGPRSGHLSRRLYAMKHGAISCYHWLAHAPRMCHSVTGVSSPSAERARFTWIVVWHPHGLGVHGVGVGVAVVRTWRMLCPALVASTVTGYDDSCGVDELMMRSGQAAGEYFDPVLMVEHAEPKQTVSSVSGWAAAQSFAVKESIGPAGTADPAQLTVVHPVNARESAKTKLRSTAAPFLKCVRTTALPPLSDGE